MYGFTLFYVLVFGMHVLNFFLRDQSDSYSREFHLISSQFVLCFLLLQLWETKVIVVVGNSTSSPLHLLYAFSLYNYQFNADQNFRLKEIIKSYESRHYGVNFSALLLGIL